MKPLQLIFLLLCFGIGLSSCRLFGGCDDDKLQMSRSENTGVQLRIDGYFYGEVDTPQNHVKNIFYFYSNGIVIAIGGTTLTNAEQGITSESWLDFMNTVRYSYGLYGIEGNAITIERWRPSQCGAKTFYETGEILNDTSFIITTREERDNGKVSSVQEINSVFYFRQGEKPDSTNNYIN